MILRCPVVLFWAREWFLREVAVMKPALVVISHYNAWEPHQLIALLDQTKAIPAGHPFRCRVVVNQADPKLLQLPDRHADVEVLYRPNTG